MSRILKPTKENYGLLNIELTKRYPLRQDIDLDQYYCPETNLNWLSDIFKTPPSKRELISFIKEKYEFIELYHSCAPEKIKDYYDKGLCTLDMKNIEDTLKALNNSISTPSSDTELKRAITEARSLVHNSDINFRKQICCHVDKLVALSIPGFCSYGGEAPST